MEVLREASLNEAIWAHLAGDQLVKKHLPITHPLVSTPDFADHEANDARSAALQTHRASSHALLCAGTKLEWVVLKPADLLCCSTPWGPTFYEAARNYERLHNGALEKWGDKDAGDAGRVNEMREQLGDLRPASEFDASMLFDADALNYSFSRTIWRPAPSEPGCWQVIDGTHRMLAVAWAVAGTGAVFPYLRAIRVS